jgi:hypothetical protein
VVEKIDELVFNASIDNIKFIKTQQWVLTSSALTLFGALTAGQKFLAVGPLAASVRYISVAAVWALAIFCWCLFCGLAKSLQNSRDEVDRIMGKKSERACFDTHGIFLCIAAIVGAGAIASSYAIVFAFTSP